jgi:hypothetical protein
MIFPPKSCRLVVVVSVSVLFVWRLLLLLHAFHPFYSPSLSLSTTHCVSSPQTLFLSSSCLLFFEQECFVHTPAPSSLSRVGFSSLHSLPTHHHSLPPSSHSPPKPSLPPLSPPPPLPSGKDRLALSHDSPSSPSFLSPHRLFGYSRQGSSPTPMRRAVRRGQAELGDTQRRGGGKGRRRTRRPWTTRRLALPSRESSSSPLREALS